MILLYKVVILLLYLIFSTVSSGMGATVCTAGRFLLVAPFTKLEEDEEEEVVVEAASVAPVEHQKLAKFMKNKNISSYIHFKQVLIGLHSVNL